MEIFTFARMHFLLFLLEWHLLTHNNMNDCRDNIFKDAITITNLVTVDLTLPSRSTMHQLVAQNIEAVQENANNARHVFFRTM